MNFTHQTRFGHQRLDAYRVALDLYAGVEKLAAGMPRGHLNHREQLRRAASAIVLNLAEGANRNHAKDKAARFTIARGECGECAAALEMAAVTGLGSPDRIAELIRLADRVSAMLTGLIRRQLTADSQNANAQEQSRNQAAGPELGR